MCGFLLVISATTTADPSVVDKVIGKFEIKTANGLPDRLSRSEFVSCDTK